MNHGHTTKHRHRRTVVDTSNGVGNEPNNALSPNSVASTISPRRRLKKKSKKSLRVVVFLISLSVATMLWLVTVSNVQTALLKPAEQALVSDETKISANVIKVAASSNTPPRQLQQLEPLTQPVEQIREEWASDVIHIVNTRFMQEQGRLKTLGMARYHQFMTFCFPSMMNQTTTEFLWIVKTDPELVPEIRNLMIEAMRPYPHFYLVGSNHNFMINKNNGSWKGGEEGNDLFNSTIYTGNLTWLQQANLLRNELPVLETRLDADDGYVLVVF